MPPSFQVRLSEAADLSDSMLIVGCPGEGLVGATAAKHIIDILKMRCVGSIRAAHQVPRSIVRDGRTGHAIQIYLASGLNIRQFRTERLIVINVERLPEAEEWQPLADEIVRWGKSVGVRVLVSPGGVTVDDEALDDKVWGAATSRAALDMLDALSIEHLNGTVGGLGAGLLHACEAQDLDGIALLAEAAPEYPDAHAAARIVRLLDKMTPAFVIPETPLIEEAERHEREIRATLDMMAASTAHTGKKRSA